MTDDASRDTPRRAFRAKLLNPGDGIETSIEIMADTLLEVEQQVMALTRSYEVEIWQGGKLMRNLPHWPRP